MDSEQPPVAQKNTRKPPRLIIVVLVAAAICLGGSGFTYNTEHIFFLGVNTSWLSGVLANVGVTLLLVIPGAWIVHRISETLQGVKNQATNAQAAAEAAASDVAELEQTVEVLVEGAQAIREELFKQQMNDLQESLLPFEAMKEKADRQSIISALQVGMKGGLISMSGLRSPIWSTESHFRFVISEEDELAVNIEDHGGAVLSHHVWRSETAAVEFYVELSDSAKSIGIHLGPMLFDPTESIQSAADALLYAAKETAQKLNSAAGALIGIIEFVDGWFITDRGMCPKGREHYFIEKHQLWRMDWESHIYSKRWEGQDFDEAVVVARALHAAEKPF